LGAYEQRAMIILGSL